MKSSAPTALAPIVASLFDDLRDGMVAGLILFWLVVGF
jgi:hypothetical protein